MFLVQTQKIINFMKTLILAVFAFTITTSSIAQTKDVVDIAIGSADHTTLVAAVKAADLVATLKGKGPFTVFAPTNAAFDKLPAGTVASLLKPENKAQLAKILTYHVVSGNMDAAAVMSAIKAGKGKAVVKTVSGGTLTASLDKDKVKLTDESGNSAYVIVADLKGSNGVVHVIDGVVLPK
ncbi:MAG: fasciclin domain-containing protein [Bacteroidetes bacterium]|nr:fasciclin domain-containing protein [Bacteroidota bacterium]